MRLTVRAFLVAFLVLLLTVTGRAAGVLVQGAIVDPAGAPIPGATVELLLGTREVAKVVSAKDGAFRFPDVGPGNYRIRVTLVGFRQTLQDIVVGDVAPAPVRVKLLVGSVTETVVVTAQPPAADASALKVRPGVPPPPLAAPRSKKTGSVVPLNSRCRRSRST